MNNNPGEIEVLVGILNELKRFNDRLDAAQPKKATPGFERDYSAYHLPGTVYPYGRNV